MILVKKHVTDKYFEQKSDFQPKPLLYSALASPGPQLQRGLTYKSWLGALCPDCLSTDAQNLQTTEVAFKSYTWSWRGILSQQDLTIILIFTNKKLIHVSWKFNRLSQMNAFSQLSEIIFSYDEGAKNITQLFYIIEQ